MGGCALAIDLRTLSKFDFDSATPYLTLASIVNEIEPLGLRSHQHRTCQAPTVPSTESTMREKSATAHIHYIER